MIALTLGGEPARLATKAIASWRGQTSPDVAAIDQFCDALRANANGALAVLYYTEWIDRWLMGDLVPGPNAVEGRRFQLTTFAPAQARDWAQHCQAKYQEGAWFAARLREAADAWCGDSETVLIVVVREVFGGLAGDDEIKAALEVVPEWMAQIRYAEA
jgi:hypothetical protein